MVRFFFSISATEADLVARSRPMISQSSMCVNVDVLVVIEEDGDVWKAKTMDQRG